MPRANSWLFLCSPHFASSPFAKQKQQPFADSASCRSRLSDYGFTTGSDDEHDWECFYEDDMVTPVKGQGAQDGCGFWAEVGAVAGRPLSAAVVPAQHCCRRSPGRNDRQAAAMPRLCRTVLLCEDSEISLACPSWRSSLTSCHE